MIELGTPDIEAIPCDGGSHYQLELTTGAGDYFLRITDPTFRILFLPMRFRTSAGGGALPLITDELSHIPRAFDTLKGQIPPDINKFKSIKDRIPSHLDLTVNASTRPTQPRYEIGGLTDDDEYPPTVFLDILVAQTGGVVITQRRERIAQSVMKAQMIFLPTELGGRYPVVAATFTNIAERLAKAKGLK